MNDVSTSDGDADLPGRARRRRDVVIPWEEAAPVAVSDDHPARSGRAHSLDDGPAGPLADAPGKWFVEAPGDEVDPRARAEPADSADDPGIEDGYGEVGYVEGGYVEGGYVEGGYVEGGYVDGELDGAQPGDGYLDDDFAEGDPAGHAEADSEDAYFDDEYHDGEDADAGYAGVDYVAGNGQLQDDYVGDNGEAEAEYPAVEYPAVEYPAVEYPAVEYPSAADGVAAYGGGEAYLEEEWDEGEYGSGGYVDGTWSAPAAVPPAAAVVEPEGPPLTPLEERLERRASKLSYRGSRIQAVYDVGGPKVRLGVLWFLLACAGLALGSLGVGAVFVTAATVASLQVAAHLMIEEDTNSRVAAAVITAMVGTSAIFDARVVGIVILLSVVAAFVVASQTIDRQMMVQVAGLTLRAALPLGIAVAALLYLHRIDAWVFMILFGVVSIYDAGNFLIGTGSRRVWVGPLAGLLGAAAVVFGAAGFEAPPLTEQTTWLLGGLAALACPFGQIIGSFMLPRPDAGAPALRRLDSYLLAAPLTLAVFLLLGGNRPLL